MLRAIIVLILAALWLSAAHADIDTGDMSLADKCKTLRELNALYRGVSLTEEEHAIKAQMVAWYRANCRRRGR